MKTKLPKILSLLLTVVLLASLMIGAAVAPAAAADGAWTTFGYPRAGSLSGYIIAPQAAVAGTSDWAVGPAFLEKAVDGTLYAYWNVAEATNLYKSADGGRTWSRCGRPTGPLGAVALVGIVCSTEDANILYVADITTVYKSADAGATWAALTAITFGTPATENITSIDVGYNGGSHYVVVGTDDTAGGVFNGDVYMKKDAFGAGWAPQGMTAASDVMAVACSPNFAAEASPQIVAVITQAANTYVTYQYGGGAWDSAATPDAELQYDPTPTSFGAVTAADIAFPANYSSTFGAIDLCVGVSDAAAAAGGDVYHVYSATAYDKDIGGASTDTNVASVAVAGSSGSAKLLATGNLSRNVYRSTDDGASWLASKKDPSGPPLGAAYVVMADDYYESGKAWVAKTGLVKGDQSAISLTIDSGVLWTQLSMIDTEITTINTLGFSPDYANDSTMFMVATSTSPVATPVNSLWRYDGTKWERVTDELTSGIASIDSIRFSPGFASDSAVFIADTTVGAPKIYRSTDGGTRFIPQVGTPAAWVAGGSWIVLDSSTMIVCTAAATAKITKNNGTTWSTKAVSGAGVLVSFSKSPDYASDSTLLVGDAAGGVFRSTDGGSIWRQIPAGVPAVAAGGNTFVAFDRNYATNSTVYAAEVSTPGVFRLVIGTDTSWKNIDNVAAIAWPAAANPATAITGMAAVPNGDGTVLYVGDVVGGATPSPILRSVNPTASRASSRGVFFEPMAYGFTGFAGAAVGPWCTAGNTLWMLDTLANANRIWTYADKLAAAPELKSPADGYNTGRTGTASLGWSALTSATRYEIWVSTDSGFSTFAGTSPLFSTTTGVGVAGLSSGRTYYWKVCSRSSSAAANTGRNVSPWSETWSVTTGIAAAEWTPFDRSAGVAPLAGASDVPIRPSFQWNPADWATGYEFELSEDSRTTARGYFVEVVTSATGANALVNTVWVCDRDLEYSTTYYWHVKAISAASKSVWGTGVFTTEAAPAAPEPPPPPPPPTPEPTTPAYIWAVIGIGAALCLAVIVLIVRTRRVA